MNISRLITIVTLAATILTSAVAVQAQQYPTVKITAGPYLQVPGVRASVQDDTEERFRAFLLDKVDGALVRAGVPTEKSGRTDYTLEVSYTFERPQTRNRYEGQTEKVGGAYGNHKELSVIVLSASIYRGTSRVASFEAIPAETSSSRGQDVHVGAGSGGTLGAIARRLGILTKIFGNQKASTGRELEDLQKVLAEASDKVAAQAVAYLGSPQAIRAAQAPQFEIFLAAGRGVAIIQSDNPRDLSVIPTDTALPFNYVNRKGEHLTVFVTGKVTSRSARQVMVKLTETIPEYAKADAEGYRNTLGLQRARQ
jgi:hypothetical protein